MLSEKIEHNIHIRGKPESDYHYNPSFNLFDMSIIILVI